MDVLECVNQNTSFGMCELKQGHVGMGELKQAYWNGELKNRNME